MYYHLSHTDLDGYGAQLVTEKTFGKENIEFYNSGYGKQIDENLSVIFNKIKSGDTLIITDLNLTEEQSERVDNFKNILGFEVILLDHHETGKPSAEKYDWYFLDSDRCATKITYDYFKPEDKYLEYIVDLIEANDLWKEEHEEFDKAKSFSQMLFDSRNEFPKVLKHLEPIFLIHFIYEIGKQFAVTDLREIPLVESRAYIIKRDFFDPERKLSLPYHVTKVHFMYDHIVNSDLHTEIIINGHKGVLFFGLSSIFQEFSHIFLRKNEEVDFVVNVSDQGRMSFRTAKDNVSMSDMCRQYFSGGGHQKASGGSLPYDNTIKKYDQELAFKIFKEQV